MNDRQRKWIRIYFLGSAILGTSWASEYFAAVFDLGNSLILLGLFGLLWVPVSAFVFIAFLKFRRFIFSLSPLSFLVAFTIHYLLSPDNKFASTLDQSTIFSIIFGVIYGFLNFLAWLYLDRNQCSD